MYFKNTFQSLLLVLLFSNFSYGQTELLSQSEIAFFKKFKLDSGLEKANDEKKVKIIGDWLLDSTPHPKQIHFISLDYIVASKDQVQFEREVMNSAKDSRGTLLSAIRVPWKKDYAQISFKLVAIYGEESSADDLVVVHRIFTNETGEWLERRRLERVQKDK